MLHDSKNCFIFVKSKKNCVFTLKMDLISNERQN